MLRRSSVNFASIVVIEQGRYSASLESALRISRVFGVGLEDVFGWEE